MILARGGVPVGSVSSRVDPGLFKGGRAGSFPEPSGCYIEPRFAGARGLFYGADWKDR